VEPEEQLLREKRHFSLLPRLLVEALPYQQRWHLLKV